MSIQLGVITLDPPVFLAPMAGITDLPYRKLVASFGAGLVVSEMVASQDMVNAKPAARAKAELGFGIAASAVQLAGRDPHWMGEAARMAEAEGARIIDINMGCPAKKVTSGSGAGPCGAALLRDLSHARAVLEAVTRAVSVPVTLKMRLGWDDACENAPQVARMAQDLGIAMLTVHGRTRAQFYKGHANWQAIRAFREVVDIPLIANGDIVDAQSATRAMAQSGANGVMVGRGAQGRPWVLRDIAAGLSGQTRADTPKGAALFQIIVRHYEDMLSFYGKTLGAKVARKHLGWYLDAAGVGDAPRRAVLTTDDPEQVLRLLRAALTDGLAQTGCAA